jgi:hypothetical protein
MKLSPVQKEILVIHFRDWLASIEATGDLPAPKGMSSLKRFVGLHQALHGPLSLPEILEELKTATSLAVLKNFRTENSFRSFANQAAKSFAIFIENIIATPGVDTTKRLVLSELLTMLTGFEIDNNFLLQKLTQRIYHKPRDRQEFKELYDLLLAYRDAVRLTYDRKGHHKLEEKVAKVINPLLDKVEVLIKKGKEDGIIDNDVASFFDAILMSLNFLANYSKIVI